MFGSSIDHPHLIQTISFAVSLIPGLAVFALLAAAALEERFRTRKSVAHQFVTLRDENTRRIPSNKGLAS